MESRTKNLFTFHDEHLGLSWHCVAYVLKSSEQVFPPPDSKKEQFCSQCEQIFCSTPINRGGMVPPGPSCGVPMPQRVHSEGCDSPSAQTPVPSKKAEKESHSLRRYSQHPNTTPVKRRVADAAASRSCKSIVGVGRRGLWPLGIVDLIGTEHSVGNDQENSGGKTFPPPFRLRIPPGLRTNLKTLFRWHCKRELMALEKQCPFFFVSTP